MSDFLPDGVDASAAIDVHGLSHTFKNHRALVNVTFRVAPESLHGFAGPNGAGKTTTLKLICTLLKPQAGSVYVFGQSVRSAVKSIRRRIGFMPDHFSMYRQMTVFEYLDFFGATFGLHGRKRRKRIDEVLEITSSGYMRDRYVEKLRLIDGVRHTDRSLAASNIRRIKQAVHVDLSMRKDRFDNRLVGHVKKHDFSASFVAEPAHVGTARIRSEG